MTIHWQEHIESTPNILCGKPRIKDTRIPVSLILGYISEGYDSKGIMAEFPDLTEQNVAACLDYARNLDALILKDYIPPTSSVSKLQRFIGR